MEIIKKSSYKITEKNEYIFYVVIGIFLIWLFFFRWIFKIQRQKL